MKRFTSTKLQAWGKTKESQVYLPLLLRQLIINNIGFKHVEILNLPGGDSIWKPGCDGIIKTTINSILGAPGEYIIECGQSEKTKAKFKRDLEKRTKEIENQKCKVFVFITTHKFQNKGRIIKEEKENSSWKDIKIFDADDIETWLDFDLATTSWLAYILGTPISNVKSFEEIKSNWLASTKVSLNADVILARADVDYIIEIIKSWLGNHDNRILQIKSDSRMESLLFFMASIEQSGFRNETIESIKSKIVVVYNIEEWRQIVETKEAKKFILVSMFSIPENLGVLKDQGFKIVITIGNADVIKDDKNIIKLALLNKGSLLNILQQKEPNKRWNEFFKQFRNNISLLALQRALARDDAPLCIPEWLKKENGLNYKILLLSALVGKWNENNSKDKEVVSKICGLDYAEITELLFSYTKFEEAPIRKIGSFWEVSAPRTIIDYIGNYLIEKDFVRYLETIKYVYLETIEIKITVSASQEYYEKPNCYSDELLKGIVQGLLIINSREEVFDQTLYIKEQSSDLVYEIVKEKDSWRVLGNYLYLFAEVAPENILESIHDTIKTNSRTINENMGYVLKPIEILANYDSNFFRYLVNLLIDLYRVHLNDRVNPLNLLAKILCPWTGYTSVQIKRMKDILSDIISTEHDNDLIRTLLLKIIQLRSCEDNELPFSQTNLLIEEYRANDIELFEFYQFLFEQLLNTLDATSAEYWEKTANSILYSFLNNKEGLFKQLLDKLSLIERNSTNEYFKHEIFNMINRGLGNENNQNNLWNKNVDQCKKLLHKISGNDPIYERTYKFLYYLNSNYYEPVQELQKIIQDISDDSLNNLITFAEQLSNPSVFGYQLGHFKFKSDQIRDLLNIGEQRSNKIHRIMSDFFAVILNIHGIRILDKIFNFQWNVEYKKLLITHISGTTDFLNWLKKHDLLELYLKNIKNASWASNEELYGSVVQGLNDVGNYTAMLQLVYWQLVIKKLGGSVKNEHIINALNGLECNYNSDDNKIQQLLAMLQTRKNVNRQDMLQLEFKYSDLFFIGENVNLKPIEIYRIFRDNQKSFIDILKGKSKSEIESSQNLQAIQLVIKHLCYKKVFPFETKEQFKQWVGELLFNLKDTDQETIKLCIYTLGNIVANSPKDPDDNIWPAKYLRETIEAIYAHNLFDRKNREYFEEGVITYKFNSIGPVFIDETCPGKPYADLAEQIRKAIIDIRDMYPCTASMLEKLAKTYQRHSVFSANWNA